MSGTRSNRLRNFSKASELVLKYSILPNLRVGLLFAWIVRSAVVALQRSKRQWRLPGQLQPSHIFGL